MKPARSVGTALLCATLLACGSDAATNDAAGTAATGFTIFGYLKASGYADAAGTHAASAGTIPADWFIAHGVRPASILYSNRFQTCAQAGGCTTADSFSIDAQALQTLAAQQDTTGAVPVILDLESWDSFRFRPTAPTGNGQSILQNLAQGIDTFRAANPAARLGLYGEVPQTTYTWQDADATTYPPLDRQYLPVAGKVDFFSPSLYNFAYDGTAAGDALWQKSLDFAMAESQSLNQSLTPPRPVYPFLTPCTGKGCAGLLPYQAMYARLDAVRQAGAAGAILWIPSAAVDPATGRPLVVDATQGWFKAVTDFAAGVHGQ